jgi:hypothetical protein
MMSRMCGMIRLAALLLVPLCFVNAEESSLKTMQMFNGRAWQEMPAGAKLIYLAAMFDGVVLKVIEKSKTDAEFDTEMNLEWTSGFFSQDYIKTLDTLYKEPENILIPIPLALKFYCTKRLKGTWSERTLPKCSARSGLPPGNQKLFFRRRPRPRSPEGPK